VLFNKFKIFVSHRIHLKPCFKEALKKIVNYEKSPNIYDSCEFQDEKSHKSYLEAKSGKTYSTIIGGIF